MRIAVVGLGKLGAPLAAVLASKGNDVLGIDVNPEAVRLAERGARARRGAGAPGPRHGLARAAERDDRPRRRRRART